MRNCILLICVWIYTLAVSPTWAETPDPVIWTWAQPLGEAAKSGNIFQMIVVDAKKDLLGPGGDAVGKTGKEAAEEVLAAIALGGYKEGEICIVLRRMGSGDGDPDRNMGDVVALLQHWCDGLVHKEQQDPGLDCEMFDGVGSCPNWWNSPWMMHGVQETGSWMAEFITTYGEAQDAPESPPDPTYFAFNNERRITATGPSAFAAAKGDDDHEPDPRWDTGPFSVPEARVYGYSKSMAGLWKAAQSHNIWFRDDLPWWDPANRRWFNWYEGVCRRICEGALDAACYAPIRHAWPQARSSNYDTALYVDSDHKYIPRAELGAHGWVDLRWSGFGDYQAPLLYPANAAHIAGPGGDGGDDLPTGEKIWEATIRVARHNIDALRQSFPDAELHPITPWVSNIGQAINVGELPEGWTCTDASHGYPPGMGCVWVPKLEAYCWTYALTADNMREMLTMLRGRKVNKILLFGVNEDKEEGPLPDEDDWDDLNWVFGQAWAYNILNYPAYPELEFVDDELGIQNGPHGGGTVTIYPRFAKSIPPPPLQPSGESPSPEESSFDMTVETTHHTTSDGATTTTVTVQVHSGPEAGPAGPEAGESPENMDVVIEAWVDEGSVAEWVKMDVSLLNWGSGEGYESAGSAVLRKAGNRTHVFHAETPASQYVSASGEVRLQIKCHHPNMGFKAMIDCVQVVELDPRLPQP